MDKTCKTCEFNFDGVCVGGGETYKYGDKITDLNQCCDNWNPNLEYFHNQLIIAPRFLRDEYNDHKISYDEFSKRLDDFQVGKPIPINFFDAIKYIYGISMVDIAVLMNVSFGVVYRAKNCGIPAKRVRQFCNALCVSPQTLNNHTTSVFAELEEGKEKFYAQKNIQIELSSMPKWKEDFSMDLSRDWLHCPIHYSRAFSRVDQFYWTPDFNKADFTQSEKELIHYICKHNKENKPIVFIKYVLNQSGRPHIELHFYENGNDLNET